MSAHERIRQHAALVAEHELRRRRPLLHSLPPHEAAAVIHAAHEIAAATADCLLEFAASEPALRIALAGIYGDDGDPTGLRRSAG
jgi:primosomal protein N'